MLGKKFIFVVKLDESENLYEVFDLQWVTNEWQDMYDRWSAGFANNDVEVIDISGRETIDIGSVWNGKDFIPGKTSKILQVKQDAACYAFLDTNKTVFGVWYIPFVQFAAKKWMAAMTRKVIGLDATEDQDAKIGNYWDGQKFFPPTQ